MKRLLVSLLMLLTGLWLATAEAAVTYQSQSSAIGTNSVISHVGAGAYASANTTTCASGSVTPAIPVGSNGDVLIALVNSRENGATLALSGASWNRVYYDNNTGNSIQVAVYWRVATGTDSLTVTQSGTCNSLAAQVSRFSGVNTGGATPFDSVSPYYGAVRQTSDNIDSGSIANASADAMLLVAGFIANNRTVTEGAGWSESFDSDLNLSRDLGLSLHYKLQPTTGSQSISNWDIGGNDINYGIIFALKPANPRRIAIAMPSGTSLNDVLIATLAVREDNAAVTAPAGWTLVNAGALLDSQQSNGAATCTNGTTNGMRLLTYYKVAVAGEPMATWGYSSTCFDDGFGVGGILRFNGVDTSNPIVTSAARLTTTSSATVTAPAVTPGIANTMLVTAFSYASSGTWTAPLLLPINRNSFGYADDTGTMLAMNTESIAAATSTGVRTATGNAAGDFGAGHSLILRPRPVVVSIASPAAVVEGNAGPTTLAFTVSLSASSSSNVTVNYAASDLTATTGAGCSTPGVDYLLASNTLTIAAGSTTGTLNATICGDTAFEADETFTVTLSSPTNATLGTSSATGTITNDDTAPTISISSASVTEGNSGFTSLIFTATLSAASGLSSSASYAFADGTATGGAACSGSTDFINTGGTVTVAAGATTGTITVPVCGDTTYETNETFTLTLSAPTNATLGTPSSATGTITDDDATPALAEYRMDEGSWSGTVGEVADSSGSYPGTAAYTAAPPSASTATTAFASDPAHTSGAQSTCRYGQFDTSTAPVKTGTYVQLKSTFPALSSSYTITAWIRSSNVGTAGQRIFVNDDASQGWAISLGDGGSGKLRVFNRTAVNSGTPTSGGVNPSCGAFCLDTSSAVIANGAWYYVAVVVDTANKLVSLYAYDSTLTTPLVATSSAFTGTWGTDPGATSIGGETLASSEYASTHFFGNIDEVRVYQKVLSPAVLAAVATQTRVCPINVPHHLVILSSGSGLTCAASTLTVTACQDATCATLFTPGVSGTLSATGTPTVNWNGTTGGFVIPNGSSSVTKDVQVATAGTVTFGIATATVTPMPTNATTCNFGTNSPTNNNCVFTANTAGFIFSNTTTGNAYTIPSQVSGIATAANALYLRAVQASTTNPAVCTPAIISSTTVVNMGYACNNPATCQTGNLTTINTTPIVPGGTPVSLNFDANGSAPITTRYDDVGRITLSANATVTPVFTGATPVALTGSSNDFVVAPHHFGFSGISVGPIKAGNNFVATVTAYNGLGTPTATRNFGKESSPEGVSMSFTKCLPTGVGTANGSFSGGVGGFDLGAASASNLNWSEVGNGDLTSTLASGSYLGSGLSASGNTGTGGTVCNGAGNVGRFTPDHFDTVATGPMTCTGLTFATACPAGGLAYSGQPFSVQVTARNAGGNPTQNYQGDFAKDVTLSAVTAGGGAAIPTAAPGGTLSPNSAAASSFAGGSNAATLAKPVFTFATTQTTPTDVYVRAIDADNVTSLRSPPSTSIEGGVKVVSGRIRIPNVYGSELLPLPMTATVQYYSGTYWLTSSTDSVTAISLGTISSAIVKGPLAVTDMVGSVGVDTCSFTVFCNGVKKIIFTNATKATGSANVSLSAPNYLLTGSNGALVNPSTPGRATFGIYKSPLIYRRENY